MAIYYVHFPDKGLVKIGHAREAERVKVRVALARLAFGPDGVLLGVREGDPRQEAAAHMRHALAWVGGETFRATRALLEEGRGGTPSGPDLPDVEQVRAWVRSWAVPLRTVALEAGLGVGALAKFADGAWRLSAPHSAGLGRAYVKLARPAPPVRDWLDPSSLPPEAHAAYAEFCAAHPYPHAAPSP